jgi:multicomponent Na+:H+ antiporter subunit G
MQEITSSILMLIGAAFMFVAGLGVIRMPDLYMRMSSSTKASTLGVGFLMMSAMVKFFYLEIISRSVAIIIFVLLTAPVAAHMIGRAAYMSGVPLWDKSVMDDLCDRYDRCDVGQEVGKGNGNNNSQE